MQAQDDDTALQKKIKNISKGACECIAEISSSLDEVTKNAEIKSCIMAGILEDQVNNTLLRQLEQVRDTLEKMEKSGTKSADTIPIETNLNNVIIVDKNYDEIEEYLLRNCTAVKELLMNFNEKSKNSVSDKQKALEYYDQGFRYYRAEEFENAVVAYRKALKKDRKFAFAWDNLGLTYRRLGNYKEAIKAYKKSLKLDPKGKVPLMNLPIAQSYLKKHKDAIESYEKYIEIYPEDPEGYYGISRMYIETKEYEKALDNAMKSFVMYKEIKSPYHQDAQTVIIILYKTMKEKDMLDTFEKLAKKYNINMQG